MPTPHFAAIDLGTNTFHLLIAAVNGTRWKPVYQEEVFVKLGRNGTQTLADEAIQKGLETLESFHNRLREYAVQHTIAAGTAALRTAANGPAFAQKAAQIIGITPAIIHGDLEASLIFKGVQSSLPATLSDYWIMDIGGGSVEFILVIQHKIHWKKSFPIGNAILTRTFHHSDPISIQQLHQLEEFLDKTLPPLWEVWGLGPPILVGAAGTFDVIAQHCHTCDTGNSFNSIDFLLWQEFSQKVITSTRQERIAQTGIPDERVDYIVSALGLVRYLLQKGKVQTWYTSTHSLKEGLLETLIEKTNQIIRE